MPPARPYQTVYDLLDALRRRPGMFLGGKSIALLQAFLSGLSFAELPPGTPSFWDFSQWFGVRARPESSSFPWHHIEESVGAERAVDAFFEYLDEFRSNTPRELARVQPPFHPMFIVVENGERIAPEIPEHIALLELTPSNVIFVCEHYAAREKPEAQAFGTIHEAHVAVERKWGVAPHRWIVNERLLP
jgi:hypothetical protein